MGKISDYANVLKSKLTDLFVVYQRNNGELETKNATLEQLGDAICGEQVHATLETDDQTIIGGINENKDKVGDLSQLTTTDKSSLVGAVNEVNSGKMANNKTLFVYSNVNGESVNVPAGGWADSPLTPTVIAGYKPLCFMNVFTSSPANLVIASYSADPNSMYIRLKNLSSNAITGYGWGRIIYIANENAN